jgi:uncharacterized protein (DUF1800 family)
MAKRKQSSFCSFHNPKVMIAGVAACLLGSALFTKIGGLTASANEGGGTKHNVFPGKLPITELTEDQAILHALNRLGFGPRPGEVEQVRQIGLENWIEQQLNPQTIDDSAVSQRLERYPTLKLSSAELLEQFPQPQQAARQAGMTPEQITQLREQIQRRQQAPRDPQTGGAPGDDGSMTGSGNDAGNDMVGAPGPMSADLAARLANLPRPQQIIQELSLAKLTRAIYSERQLDEALTDFWFNHFNIFAGKGADRWLLTSYERESIRPHTLGKFEDLLAATAKSPAMQFYLDNWQSADPEAYDRIQDQLLERRRRLAERYWMTGLEPPQPNPQNRQRRGLNENYARELMELHTLGVQGGYTQKDITEVARVFTGWTIRQPRQNPEFYFEARLHDPGTKVVLGKKIHGGGMKEGEEVLHLLAHHPSTAHFISLKLAERFVSDQPPQGLVDRMAAAFLKSDGDIRTVMRTMIYSPDFWSREAYHAKIKKPFELVASTVRAIGFDGDLPAALVQWSARIGEPLYQCQPPNGYSDKADAWVNTGALLNRMNFALQVAGGRNARPQLTALLGADAGGTTDQLLSRFISIFLGGDVSDGTRATLESKLAQVLAPTPAGGPSRPGRAQQNSLAEIAGLVLGSPEFQRR